MEEPSISDPSVGPAPEEPVARHPADATRTWCLAILLVAAPLALFAVLLGVANSRAKRRAAERETGSRAGGGASSGS